MADETSMRDRLADAVRTGIPLGIGLVRPQLRTDANRIDASDVREVLLDEDVAKVADPSGLTIYGAFIAGSFDLRRASVGYAIWFENCTFDENVDLSYGRFEAVSFGGSSVPSLSVEGAEIRTMLLMRNGFTCTHGSLNLYATRIGAQLQMTDAVLEGRDNNGYAIYAINTQVGQDVYLNNSFRATSGAISLHNAHVGGDLVAQGATLGGADTSGNALSATGLHVEGSVSMRDLVATTGAIQLYGADIGGQLELTNATLDGADHDGYALAAVNLHVGRDAYLDGTFACSEGAIQLYDARIGGQLQMTNATIGGADASGVALEASSFQTEGHVYLNGSFRCESGAIRLITARVGGQLQMTGATLKGADGDGNAVDASWLQTGGNVHLDRGFTCSAGAVELHSARIGGWLLLSGARLTAANSSGYALAASGLQTTGHVYLDEGFTSTAGAIQLYGARLGQLVMSGASITGADASGYAINAESMEASSHVFLNDGFTCAVGAIHLFGARVGGELNMTRASLEGSSPGGYALGATNLRIESEARLSDGFTCTQGSIQLNSARIGGQLRMSGADLQGKDSEGVALRARGLVVDGVLLDGGFRARTGLVDLSDASINRDLVLAGGELGAGITLESAHIGILDVGDNGTSTRLVNATGWSVGDVQGVIRNDRRAARRWLKTSDRFTAQPWQELAGIYDRNGQPSDARWLRYQVAVEGTSKVSGWTKVARQSYRATSGHGYYPLLAVVWILGLLIAAYAITATHADSFTTATTTTIREDLVARAAAHESDVPQPVPGRVTENLCSDAWDTQCFDPGVYTLSAILPAASQTQSWQPPSGWVSVALQSFRIASWALTAILLAGLTGLLRKQT